MTIHIVLVEPEIPQNTGNIARSCVAAGAVLHLVRPLGFKTDDKALKRAGLDYWSELDIAYYDHINQIFEKFPHIQKVFVSTKAPRSHTHFQYETDTMLFFGKESSGLPEALLKANLQNCVRIPMKPHARSLNLSNAVAIVLYEALRQNQFTDLQGKSSRLWG